MYESKKEKNKYNASCSNVTQYYETLAYTQKRNQFKQMLEQLDYRSLINGNFGLIYRASNLTP